MHARLINFRNITYSLDQNNKLKIYPIAPTDESKYEDEFFFNEEKFVFDAEGEFDTSNINQSTLDKFAEAFSQYKEALERLT